MARKIMTAHLALNRLCWIITSQRQVSEWDSLRLGPWPISVIDHLLHFKNEMDLKMAETLFQLEDVLS